MERAALNKLFTTSHVYDTQGPLLVVQLYAGLLLPLYFRYSMERRAKALFLQQHDSAAADSGVCRVLLAVISHVGWLVLLAALASSMAQLLQTPLLWLAGAEASSAQLKCFTAGAEASSAS